jgi:hypothetical protein
MPYYYNKTKCFCQGEKNIFQKKIF